MEESKNYDLESMQSDNTGQSKEIIDFVEENEGGASAPSTKLNVFGKRESKVEIAENEERLHRPVKIGKMIESVKEVYAGIDVGSTQTRTMMTLNGDLADDWMDDVIAVPSAYAVAPKFDLKAISANMYDNLEVLIIDKTVTKKVKVFQEIRVVKGALMKESTLDEQRINSSVWKINQSNFYINILVGLATRILVDSNGAEIFKAYRPKIGVSLPPEEIESEAEEAKFLGKLAGEYLITFPRYNVTVEMQVLPENINIQTEPEAALKAHYAVNEIDEPSRALHIDGGGRSTGVAILLNGILNRKASVTLPYGGTQLIQDIIDLYVQEIGGRKPTMVSVEEALNSGILKIGKETKDIALLIEKAKKGFAGKMYNDILVRVFDRLKDVTPDMIEEITFSGKLFRSSEYDNANSIADFFGDVYKAVGTGTEFSKIELHNPIALGNFIKTVAPLFEEEV